MQIVNSVPDNIANSLFAKVTHLCQYQCKLLDYCPFSILSYSRVRESYTFCFTKICV